jgi:N-acetylmuramoyl-L-alanine amidase
MRRGLLSGLALALAATAAAAEPGIDPVRGIVFIDPGHGGRDPGAVVAGLREKDVTLAVADMLEAALSEAGFTVARSRHDDRHVALDRRVALAQEARADLLLSLHADTVTVGAASGASVYRLADEATDALAAELAAAANAGAPATPTLAAVPPDLRAMLGSMMMAETEARTDLLASAVVAALGERVPLLSGRPLRGAAFRVLMAPDIPSVLVELGFMSHPADRARLIDPAWRAEAVAALVTAVERWFSATDGVVCARQACQESHR